MPKILDNKLFIFPKELILCEVAVKSRVYKVIQEGNVTTYQSEEHGKLIEFKSLKWDWKQKVNEFYNGCVKTYAQLELLKKGMGICPEEDKDFLMALILPNGTHLEQKKRLIYEQKCKVLGFLARLHPLTDEKAQQFGTENVASFWQLIAEYIKTNSIKLPKNNRRLTDTFKKYLKEGTSAIISGKFGNSNSIKLGEAERMVIVELYAQKDGRKFTKKQVHKHFLAIAEEKGWEHCKNVTYRSVAKVLSETKGQWMLERHGSKNFMLDQVMTINKRKVSGRNLVWQLDGTPEHLWYYDPIRKTVDKLYVMKVMDSRSWKIVGYSIGYAETSNLVFEAVKMACTLHGVKPLEVRSDKGSAMQSAETKELMENLGARYYPTATGNARAKSIEAWQKLFNQQVLTYFVNKSGGNVTVKDLNSKQNPDKLKQNYKKYPTKEEYIMQLRKAFAVYDNLPNSKGITPQKIYDQSIEKGKPLSIFEQFECFAIWRKKGKKIQPYEYNYRGLTLEVGGERYRYIPELSAEDLATFNNQHIDTTTFYVKYDPSDLKQIALYDLPNGAECVAENMRFVCDVKLKGFTSETNMDATQEEKERYKHLRKAQIEQVKKAKEATSHRRDYLTSNNLLIGSIELERIHKDSLNNAELEVQRLEMLGYGSEITSDTNKELSALSMLDDWSSEEIEGNEDLNVYGLPKST